MLGPASVIDGIRKGGEMSEEVQEEFGLIPRAIIHIFEEINKKIEESESQFQMALSYFELYNGALNNLLDKNPATS